MEEDLDGVDFVVRTGGSVWQFMPLTEIAKNFTGTDLDLESWQWMGPWFCVDGRLANNLVTALEEEGFILKLE